MRRKLYLTLFLAMATLFVPVVLSFGMGRYVVPAVCIALGVGAALFQAQLVVAVWSFVCLSVYLYVYYTLGRLAFWLSKRPASQAGRLTIQIVGLFALFACSFVRAITYDSLQGRGGTYTFWGAVWRFFERWKQWW